MHANLFITQRYYVMMMTVFMAILIIIMLSIIACSAGVDPDRENIHF